MLYILNGHEPAREKDLSIWAMFFQDEDKRRVALSKIDSPDGVIVVSTVFLASDHSFGAEGPPILFETLVSGGGMGIETRRCSTWKQAEQQHKDIVKEIQFTH
jgi:hypothetical protein